MDDAKYESMLVAAKEAWGEAWHQHLEYNFVYEQLGMPRGKKVNKTAQLYYHRLWADLNRQHPAPVEPDQPAQKKKKQRSEVTVSPKFSALPPQSHLGGRYGLLEAIGDTSSQEPRTTPIKAGLWGVVGEQVVPPHVATAGAGPSALRTVSGGQE